MSRTAAAVLVASALVGCGPDVGVREVCGYRCGPMASCPDGFACYADGRCHREGSPESLGCTLDGGPDYPPSIASAHPADDELDWPTDAALLIVFDEPVIGVDASTITLRHRGAIPTEPVSVSYDEQTQTATVVPATALDMGATYVITVARTIRDATGNRFTQRSWEFTTVTDTSPPRIATVSPAPGAMNVGVETPITISFDEPVYNVTPSGLTIVNASTGASAGQISYISPMLAKWSGPWAPNTLYRVSLTSAIRDRAGNSLDGAPHTWLFTSGPDTVPPRITSQVPAVGEQGVQSLQIKLVFSEPMLGLTSQNVFVQRAGTLLQSNLYALSDLRTWYVSPLNAYAPNSTYQVTILPSVTDMAGNPIAPGVLRWTFTTWQGSGQ